MAEITAVRVGSMEIPIADVGRLNLVPGDSLLVKVGLTSDQMGGTPWIPTDDDLTQVRNAFEYLLPEGVDLVVTHIGVDATVVGVDDSAD